MKYVDDNPHGYDMGKRNKKIPLSLPNFSHNADQKIKDLICFSHLRWNLVFQRPQHLLTRWAKEIRVFYFEEPLFDVTGKNFLEITIDEENDNIFILTPHLIEGYNEAQISDLLYYYVNSFIQLNQVKDFILWYLTPMSLPFTKHLNAKIVVYDCMDELSCFKGAHPQMHHNETMLMKFADTVFTGGYSLYEYKKDQHFNIHPFPSSIDQTHFENGHKNSEPRDQSVIPNPKVGFLGIIDERLDIKLLDGLALAMPEFHFIMIGPVLKIDEKDLPKHRNLHYLGPKKYTELPSYLAYWDVAFLPFAKNDSTRFISPTKTPEYLCAGKPVVSTSIHDVKDPYGDLGLVHIADSIDDFCKALLSAMAQKEDDGWKRKVSGFLNNNSWDLTFARMKDVIYNTLEKKEALNGKSHTFASGKLTEKKRSASDVRIRIW